MTQKIEVTQADRDAAAEYLALVIPTFPNLAEKVQSNQSALARAFAHHRHAAEGKSVQATAELVDGGWA